MIKVETTREDDGTVRVFITSDDDTEDGELGNVDSLNFCFSHEGLIIDAVENGVVVGTECAEFADIIDRLH